MLLLLSLRGMGADMEIPQRPQGYVTDFAQVMGDSVNKSEDQAVSLNRTGKCNMYVVTMPVAYQKDIDSFAARVCRAWQICGEDNSTLLVISTGKASLGDAPLVKIIAGSAVREPLDDTVLAYIRKQIYDVVGLGPSVGIWTYLNFVEAQIQDPKFIRGRKDYHDVDMTYRPGPDLNAVYMARPSTGRYFWLVFGAWFLCMVVFFIYMMSWREYQSYLITQTTISSATVSTDSLISDAAGGGSSLDDGSFDSGSDGGSDY